MLKYRQKINDDKDKSAEKQSVASNSSEDEDNSGLNTSFKKKLDDKKQNKEGKLNLYFIFHVSGN